VSFADTLAHVCEPPLRGGRWATALNFLKQLNKGNALDNIIFIIITVFVIAFVLWLSLPGKIDRDQHRHD
jgi:hypothetical protein